LADGPAPAGPALAGRECGQLLRLWVDPPVRDHLPAPDPGLRDGHRRFGACRDPGHGHPRDTPTGTLLDHFRPKPILIAGNLTSALGYAGFAFVDRPWQAFACAVVGGAGVGAARTANQTLLITLVTPEQRAASFALGRVASSLGLGSLATVAGFIVASAQHLRSFQTLYLFDAMACAKAIAAGDPSYRTRVGSYECATYAGLRGLGLM
jgi:MFS family permease